MEASSRGVARGGARAPPEFGRSVNPIQTRGGRLCPSHYFQPPRIQKAIYISAVQAIKKQIDAVREGKKLSNTSIKKQTKLVHEEKKLYKCSICTFSSELAIDLKRHMLSNHGGQKTFNCAICDDTFEQKINLQNHIESVHRKKVPLDSL